MFPPRIVLYYEEEFLGTNELNDGPVLSDLKKCGVKWPRPLK